MLGVVFTELLEMVETRFSMDTVDVMLDRAAPSSGGSYTAVGNYDADEILRLVTALSEHTGVPVATLVRTFGQHLFGRLVEGHPAAVRRPADAGFLARGPAVASSMYVLWFARDAHYSKRYLPIL